MKLCVIIHSPLQVSKTISYAKQRVRDGAKVIYLSFSPFIYDAEGLIALSELGKLSPKNLAILLPDEGKRQTRFSAYKSGFKNYLSKLNLKPKERVIVEFVGGADDICFRRISKPALEEIIRALDPRFRNLFGKKFERKFKDLGGSRVVAHTLLSQVFGYRDDNPAAHKVPRTDFRKSALRVNRKSVRRRAP